MQGLWQKNKETKGFKANSNKSYTHGRRDQLQETELVLIHFAVQINDDVHKISLHIYNL